MSYMKTPNTLKQEKSETIFISEEIKDTVNFEYLDSYEDSLIVVITIHDQIYFCELTVFDYCNKKIIIKSEREDIAFLSMKNRKIKLKSIDLANEKIIIDKQLSLDKISRINNSVILEFTFEE